MFSFSAPQISGKDHQSQCPLMLRCWHQQMQLGVCLAQTATLAAQSCRRSLWALKRALQEPLAWAQDLIRVRSTVLQHTRKTVQSPSWPLVEKKKKLLRETLLLKKIILKVNKNFQDN